MIHLDTAERRRRLVARQLVPRTSDDVVAIADRMVGLHSSDPATVFLSARARIAGFLPDHLESALYDERTLLRQLGMRRTLFVVPSRLAGVIEAACTQKYAASENRRLVKMIEEQGLADDGAAWLESLKDATVAALEERGPSTGRQLREAVPELQETLVFAEGKAYGGKVALTTRVLFLLATQGRITRARPLGSWLSSQYHWAPLEAWMGRPLDGLEPQAARAELVSRYLSTFGPATLTDVKWWAGWTVAETREALGDVGAVEVSLDEGTGFVLEGDVDETTHTEDAVALLPSLDPTTMGWKEREWFLGPHVGELFDRNGNAGPTIWANGAIVGGWAQRKDGEIVTKLLEDVPNRHEGAIEAEAEELRAWMGEIVVTPRFRSPLDKRLSA